MSSDASAMKEWKSFYYPNQYHHTQAVSNAVPFAWSNGVINNNNLLNVGSGYTPIGGGYSPLGGGGGGTTGVSGTTGSGLAGGQSTLQCLLFGVMGLVTFLLNSVMALLLSLKLPGLDGLLGGLLGGVGLGGGLVGALTKQDVVASDTKSKHMEYVHFPDNNNNNNHGPGGNAENTHQENLEYFDKNR